MTLEDILHFEKYLRFHNVSIHRKFYKNRLILIMNVLERKKLNSRNFGIKDFFLGGGEVNHLFNLIPCLTK